MKKFICLIVVIAALMMLVSCNTNKIPEATDRVQSVVFRSGDHVEGYASKWRFVTECEEVSEKEFNNADKTITQKSGFTGGFNADGSPYSSYSAFEDYSMEQLEDVVGSVYYYAEADYNYGYYKSKYYKITFEELELSYVNVSVLDDGSVCVSYYDFDSGTTVTKLIKSDFYTITYFTE